MAEEKPKKKRKPPKFETLEPTPSQLKKAREMLTPFYEAHPERRELGESIKEKVDQIIESAKIGWAYCPKTFEKRCERAAKIKNSSSNKKWTDGQNYHANREKAIHDSLAEAEKKLTSSTSVKELRKILPKNEKKLWEERELQYRQDFDLNDSSDQPLLNQVIVEEIQQNRLMKKRLEEQYIDDPKMEANLEKQITNSQNRMNKALNDLGVTRAQREKAGSDDDGNIANLVVSLEKKKANIAAEERKQKEQEEALMEAHFDKASIDKAPKELKEVLAKAMDSEDYLW